MSRVILLIEAINTTSDYPSLLRRAGFTVQVASHARFDEREILTSMPALIAVELDPTRSPETFESARRLRLHPQLRNTPIIVFATLLDAEHIETAARSGLLWLQVTPVDKLVAAARGLLSATEGASGPFGG
jgi:CheY-like chemotaxis protein